MATTYVQAFNPIWYIPDVDGRAAGGAQLFTYDSLTRAPRVVYQDPAGTIAWPNPLIFMLNGTAPGPIYWQQDSTKPNDNYYFEIYNALGLLLESGNNFPVGNTGGGGGGGGTITEYIPVVNYITNNQFIDHIADQAGPLPINVVIAPSNHKGFTPAVVPVIGTYGALGPDIRFVKNIATATDSVTFPDFDLSDAPLTLDVTPVSYIRYVSDSVIGEQYKSFQFPITQKVKNLSNTKMTFGVWAKVAAAPVDINIFTRQYYGSGTAATPESGATRFKIDTHTLTTSWTWYPTSFTVQSVAANSLGTPGLQTDDDALYIQIDMPLDAACDVWFTKPVLVLGAGVPDAEFDSYDMIDSIDQTPRCGDTKLCYSDAWSVSGWLYMNNGTIGNIGSGATQRAGKEVYQLYKTLWDNIADEQAPVSTGRGATATADFLAGKTIRFPVTLGQALASFGGAVIGQTSGAASSSVTLAAANIPAHTHTTSILSIGSTFGFGFANGTSHVSSSILSNGGQSLSNVPLTDPPTAFVVPTLPPTTYLYMLIKL